MTESARRAFDGAIARGELPAVAVADRLVPGVMVTRHGPDGRATPLRVGYRGGDGRILATRHEGHRLVETAFLDLECCTVDPQALEYAERLRGIADRAEGPRPAARAAWRSRRRGR